MFSQRPGATQGAKYTFSPTQKVYLSQPMLYLTDSDILNPGNSTVIVRAGIRPSDVATRMGGLMAFPIRQNNGLSRLVFYRPRAQFSGNLPGYSRTSHRGTEVLEVMGFQIGREGLIGRALQSFTFPKLRPSRVQRIS